MALIYIVEDDQNIREIESFALKNSGYQIQDFSNAKDFHRAVKEKRPDLALLDIMLPDEDGMEILQKLRKNPETKRLPIIMVTAKSTELDRVKGLDNGADDYIVKPFGVMELISRVKALLRRSMGEEQEKILKVDEILLDDERHLVFAGDKQCDLTYKEYELLRLLMQNRGIVLSRDVIMDRIWDMNCDVESRTLDVHLKTLRAKLGDSAHHIKTIRNVGYRME
ncbi:MAG: response regulator transcription factor [Lachnospiraceae bacterium]|nr:response regulator transcription factor [Lachnospiraceae bacterium]MEE1015750.1 response regulator transcription factor [Lachnospiraceae bacterium]